MDGSFFAYYSFSLSVFWISRSLHSKLRLGSSSSSSLTDLSQAKTPGGGGDKGATTGGLSEECSRDKGTQQRRAGANATWNRLVCERLTCIFLIGLKREPCCFAFHIWLNAKIFGESMQPCSSFHACMFTHTWTCICVSVCFFSLAAPCLNKHH